MFKKGYSMNDENPWPKCDTQWEKETIVIYHGEVEGSGTFSMNWDSQRQLNRSLRS